MSLTEMLGRVQQIQATLSQLEAKTPATVAAGTAGASGTGTPAPDNAASAAAFAQALSAAGTAGTAASPSASAAAGSAAAAGQDANAGQLVAAAKKYIGLPYVWGGTDPAVGLDCSSFVQSAFRDVGIDLPRVTWDQMKEGTEVASLAEAQPGDLIFSHDGGHVSIYLGNGKAIDAPQPGDTIQIRDAWENDGNITTIRRVLPSGAGTSAAAAPAGTSGSYGGPGAAGSSGNGTALTDLVAAAQASLVTGGAA